MAELRDAGLIRHLGVSNARPEHLAQAQEIAPVVCVQNSYGLGHRPGQDQLLRACGEQGVAFVPFFAIAGAGREAGPSGAEPGEVLAVDREHQATPAQVRLPGLCNADRTCWSSRAHPTLATSPTTSLPERYASRPATWPDSTQFTRTSRKPTCPHPRPACRRTTKRPAGAHS